MPNKRKTKTKTGPAKRAAKTNQRANKVTARSRRPKLTGLQKRFVDILHSMKRPHRGKAYGLAGSQSRGHTAAVEANRTLAKPHVAAYLKKLQRRATERAEKKADDIIAELEKVGFSNIGDYLTLGAGKVKLKESKDLTVEQMAAVAEVWVGTEDITRLKLYDKLRALKDLGLRFGIFPTKIEHKGLETLAQAVHKAMKDDA